MNAITQQIASAFAAVAPAGFAVVTGSALQRLRLRRVLDVVRPTFFDRPDEAAAHLGWEPDWRAAFSSPVTPPRAPSLPGARRS